MTTPIPPGAEGAAVRDLQRRLARWAAGQEAFGDLPVTGTFDEATERHVRAFQRERGLPATGRVGEETWRAIVEASYSLGDRLLWHSRSRMRGDDVVELQHRLNRLGFDAGLEDGIFGPGLRAAVEEFQRNAGLDVDGVVGPRTLQALVRLHRGHQAGGVGARVRELHTLDRLPAAGLQGLRLVVDPAGGPEDAPPVGPAGTPFQEVTWALGTRLARRLDAHGAWTALARGPSTNPSPSQRAALANELDVDLVVSISANLHDDPRAQGCASYYYGSLRFVSEAGRRLAGHAQKALITAGWTPDCRIHPMTWALLRETRMPAVVVEPAFLSSPQGEEWLADPERQEALAVALTHALDTFVRRPVAPAPASAGGQVGSGSA